MAVVHAETPQWLDTLARVELFVNTESAEPTSVVLLLKRGRRTGELTLDFDGLPFDDARDGELVHTRLKDLTAQLDSALLKQHDCSSRCKGRKKSSTVGRLMQRRRSAQFTLSTRVTTPGSRLKLTTFLGCSGQVTDTTDSSATNTACSTSVSPPQRLLNWLRRPRQS